MIFGFEECREKLKAFTYMERGSEKKGGECFLSPELAGVCPDLCAKGSDCQPESFRS